jgi:hypothetical protein
MLRETRHSGRIQDQLLKKHMKQNKDEVKKNALGGMIPNTNNSFFVLNNDAIVDISRNMGVKIPEENFDVIDMMKDLECARQAMEKVKITKESMNPEEVSPEGESEVGELPLLEWFEADSETEQFTNQGRK